MDWSIPRCEILTALNYSDRPRQKHRGMCFVHVHLIFHFSKEEISLQVKGCQGAKILGSVRLQYTASKTHHVRR